MMILVMIMMTTIVMMISGSADDDILGAWFMWPEGGFNRPRGLPEDSTLIVYFHGNSQDRGFGHRVGYFVFSTIIIIGILIIIFMNKVIVMAIMVG